MTRPDREKMPYRDCVGVAVFNSRGQVFIGRRGTLIDARQIDILDPPGHHDVFFALHFPALQSC